MCDIMVSQEVPQIIIDLVKKFKQNEHLYTNPQVFDEENTKTEFINPFFKALGWDIYNETNKAPQYKEVVFEDSIKVGGKTKAPDYSFRLGGQRIFFVEAKKPSVDIEKSTSSALQVRRYGWSANLKLCILTDFQELSIYDTTVKPEKNQDVKIAKIAYYKYTDYIEKWDEIYNIFSKDAVEKGSFDNFADGHIGTKKGTSKVDQEFLKEIDYWRILLARNIALRNEEITSEEDAVEKINYAVQLIIDRIIFLRIAEDRGIEKYGQLKKLIDLSNSEKDDYPVYNGFLELCKNADLKYNSGLFHFKEENEISLDPDEITPTLKIDDNVFKTIFKNLYYPNCPYEFSVISTEILGSVYERFLGKIIRLTPKGIAKVEFKPEVKKAGGVYYTPNYIVHYIVKNTVGKLIDGYTPNKISNIKILDPACGSGSFLLEAYQQLLDYHLNYYINQEKPPKNVIYRGKDNEWRLTIQEKKRILLNNIYGVDLDSNAVEVTKLSLLLKVLEDQNKDEVEQQQKLFQERALPYLGENIKCGNSLIGTDIWEQEDLELEESNRVNPFDWEEEFEEIFDNGGFDVIIGNPPYVSIENIKSPEKEYLKRNYKSEKRFDMYVLFIEKTLKLLKDYGLHSFIIPDKFCNQNYASIVRNTLLENVSIEQIVDFRMFKLFNRATVKNIVYVIKNVSPKANHKILIIRPNIEDMESENIVGHEDLIEQSTFKSCPERMFRLDCTPNKIPIIKKIKDKSINLEEICYCSFGFQPGNLKKFTFNKLSNPERELEHPDCIKKFIRGRNIKPYFIEFKEDYVFYLPDKLHRPAFPDLFENPKIVISEISDDIIATLDYEKYYGNEKTINVLPWSTLENVDEKILKRRGIVFNKTNVELSEKYNLNYLLSILTSKTARFYFKVMISDDLNVYPDSVRKLPIPNCLDDGVMSLLSHHSKRMLKLNKSFYETKTPKQKKLLSRQMNVTYKKINELVYGVYGFSHNEIEIIENYFKDISKNKSNN